MKATFGAETEASKIYHRILAEVIAGNYIFYQYPESATADRRTYRRVSGKNKNSYPTFSTDPE